MAHPLLQSLIHAPLLIEDLPEAPTFPRHQLILPADHPVLNFEQKLGHLYEDALALLLNHSPSYELLERNLQIQKDRHTTVGELDFLLRETDSEHLIHLELATKFYLAVETDGVLTLPGPDARDNYFRKLARLRAHQLQLPLNFRRHLPEKYRDQPIATQQLIIGCLFDHIETTAPATAEFLNPNCRRGRWLDIDELPQQFSSRTRFHIIPKPLWPVPIEFLNPAQLEPWSPGTPLKRHLMVRADDRPEPYFIRPSQN